MAGKPGMIRRKHQDDVRGKIQASQIINRLTSHVLGEIELTATQVSAAKILLDKRIANAPTDDTLHVDGKMDLTGLSWLQQTIQVRNAG